MRKKNPPTCTVILLFLCILQYHNTNAQSACESYYASAVKYQQTMTVASQKQALIFFEKAMNCYDSQSKKQLCKSQIATCRNTIALIKKKNTPTISEPENVDKKECVDSLTIINKNKHEKDYQVVLVPDQNIIRFKSKGNEFKKIKITCNYDDWKIVKKPDWISYSINSNNEIICEAEKNTEKSERDGMIVIECKNTSCSIAVYQSKKGLF